jgi:tetratricopeptide (TPR) repeat protein
MLLADIEQTVGVINYKLKRYDKAIGNCTASIDIRKRLKNKETSSIAYCYHIIGLSHLEIERLDDATVNITMSYDIYNKLCGESSNEVASEMLVLGQILISQKKYNDALNILLKSLNIKKKINETSKDVAEVCDQIAISYHMISKYSTALQYFNKSFIIKQVRFAGQDPTICLHNILGRAISHHERGDYDEAFDLYKKAISIHEDMVRCQTVDQAMLYNNMGCLLRATGKPDEALMYIQKALKILNELAPITLYVANCFENLGNVHFEKKDLNICYSYWNQAMELRSKIAGDKSIEIAQSYVNLSSYYKATKLYDKAEVYLLKSLNIYQCSYKSSKHPDIGYVYFCLAMLKKEMGDNMSSFEFLSGAKEMYNGYENEKPEICKQIYGCISGYYSNSKKYTDACATLESLVEKCYDVNTKCKADIEEISNIYQSISCICNKTKNYNKAIIFLTKSYDLINKEYGELNYLSAKCVYFLAKEYMLLPNYALAKECLIKAKKVFTHIYGKDSSYCIKIEQNMAECNHVLTD